MLCPYKFGYYEFEGGQECIGNECGMHKLCNAETEITAVEFDALDEHAQALERENAELRKLCGANDTLSVENDVSATSVDANDSHAKLEEDRTEFYTTHERECLYQSDVGQFVFDLLDRKAAITEREWIDTECAKCGARENERDRDFAELQAKVDELTEQRDRWRSNWTERNIAYSELADECQELEAKVDELTAERGELQAKVDVLDIENSELCDEIAALNELRGELTRERDGYHEEKVRLEMELAQAQGLLSNVTHNHAAAKAKYERAQIDAKRARERQEEAERKYDELLKKPPEGAWAERIAELEAERDEFRDRLGKVLDLAGEIGGLA